MPSSEARIAANKANSLKSRGPKTPEGKSISRQNALKHGLTGAGVVLPVDDALAVERVMDTYAAELDARGELELDLCRDAALCQVRMARLADQETAMLTERVIVAEAEFEAPEDFSPAETALLKNLAIRQAMFDPSKEARLARQYEAAARRGFYKALKELRELRKERRAEERVERAEATAMAQEEIMASSRALVASFSNPREAEEQISKFRDELARKLGIGARNDPPNPQNPRGYPPIGAALDLSIGSPSTR